MLGRNLKALRKKKNLTQENLANSLSVSRQAICLWERGERTPKISTLTRVSRIFGVSIDHMVNGKLTVQDDKLKKKR